MDTNGKVDYQRNGEGPLTENASDLVGAIDDHSVIANINVNSNLTSSVTGSLLIGEFQGSSMTGNVDSASGLNVVSAQQEVNVSVTCRLDNDNGTPGVTTLHETMEAYQGGKIAQRDNLSTVPPAVRGIPNPVYSEAHNSVVPHSPIGGVTYTKNQPSPNQVIYNSSTEGFIYTPKGTIVQTFPNKMD